MHPQGRYVCYPERTTSRVFKENYTLEKPKVVRKVAPCLDEEEVDGKKKKTGILPWIIWGLILALALWWFFDWMKKRQTTNKGRLIIAITSNAPRLAALSRPGNNLTKASAVIDHIQVLPTGQGKGWTNISNSNQTIDLLALRNAASRAPQIITDSQVLAGQYQKARFHISKVTAEDVQGSKFVYLPGNNVEFEIPFTVSVKKDVTTAIVLDIPLDESLRDAVDETGRPVKVFAPVIYYESKGDSQVSTTPNKRLTFQKIGVVQGQGTVSMDVNGQVEKGTGIPQNIPLKVERGKVFVVSAIKGLADTIKGRVDMPDFVDRTARVQPESPPTSFTPQPDSTTSNGSIQLVDDADVGVTGEGQVEGESSQGNWKAYPALLHGKYNRGLHK